jgi:hypothetical protein
MALKFRRGTTAQQSGSLEYGEPYVNTTLGTLLIGGVDGDIVLSSTGTGSTGNFGPISGSGLDITGNANIAGNLTLGGQLTIGDATTDTVNVVASLSSSLIPSETNAFDLGSADKVWKDLYVSTGSIKFVAGNSVVGTLSANGNGDIVSHEFRIKSGSNPQLIFENDTTGIEYHIQNGNAGNFQLHNGTTDKLLMLFSSSSTNPDAYLYGNLSVSKSFYSDRVVSTNITGSLKDTTIGSLVGYSASVDSNLKLLQSATSSANVSISNLNTYTASNDISNTTQNSRLDQLSTVSGSSISRLNTLESKAATLGTYTASVDSVLTQLVTASGSAISRLNNIESFSGSQNTKDLTLESYTSSVDNKFSTLSIYTASVSSRLDQLSTDSGSQNARITSLESKDLTLATTGSNLFFGDQTITGSMYISGDIIVQGSSSLQNITASAVSIGTNTIILNTATPAVRYAGMTIIDSGSSGVSASLLWDSQTDDFIFTHRASGSATLDSSMFMFGPLNNDSLDSIVGILPNRLSKGEDNGTGHAHHITSSQISDDGTTVSIPGNLNVTGSITSTSFIGSISATNGVVSGSSQVVGILSALNTYTSSNDTTNATQTSRLDQLSTVSGSSISRLNTLEIETANLEAFSSSAIGRLNTLEIETANLEAFSSSAIGRLNTLEIETANLETFSASALTRLSTLEGKDISITLTGDVTGTGTITDLANVSFATTIAANSVALGTDTTGNYVASMTAGTGITVGTATGEGSTPVITNTGVTSNVAGTGVSVSGGTGAVTISIGQAVATSSNVQFNSLGIGMAASATAGRIDATNDIVAFSSSDIRFKENIKPIENPLEKISKISGNTYDWKAENKIEHGYEGNDVGVIAQEIEAVLPQLVQTRENGFKAVKYDKLVALLIEGIKEQQLQIEQLRIDLNNSINRGL